MAKAEGLVLLALLCVGVLCFEDNYSRTVSYEEEVLVKCSSLGRDAVQHLLESDGVDVWRVGGGGSVDFRVSSEQFQRMKGELPGCREAGSVEQLVREEEQRRAKRQFNQTQQEWHEEYHRYADIVNWWLKLAEDNPDLVKYEESIGKSLEGRDMPAVRITASPNFNGKKIYFQCQIHAREWISGAVCMHIADELLIKFINGDELVKEFLTKLEVIFIPFVNPDGYEYTWTNNRLWCKNRRPPPSGSMCAGVDLNRNYDDHWGEGSSPDPCSETYHGTGPASEPETQNTQNFFRDESNIVGSVDWHSYGQLILRPYGWTLADCPDEAQLKELGDQMSEDIIEGGGRRYISQKASQLYPASGSAMDWCYGDDANSNSPYRSASYVIELRDTGLYGFQLPPDQIIPNGEEVFPAVIKFGLRIEADPILRDS